jgi:pimeloyl-ACP methyl ester carboxylesterase
MGKISHGRALLGVPLAALVALGALVAAPVAGAGADAWADAGGGRPPDPGRHTFTGTIDGADYLVETPEDWNGMLVLYSHGYYPPGFPSAPTVSNSPETAEWLVDHGFALAASNYRGVTGFQVDRAQRDQLALLDWFDDNVGRPDRTISMGQSQGAAIADLLAERHPNRFDGVVDICSGHDALGTFTSGFDVVFAVKTLLAPDLDIDLVHPRDPEGDTSRLVAVVDAAMATPEGRARLALAGSFNNVTGWWSALQPRPTDPAEEIRQQALWTRNAYVQGFASPLALANLAERAGGNPVTNVGVDYGRQLARSSQRHLAEHAYREAGLDLRADLDQLAAAPRVAADRDAVAFMYRTSVPRGRLSVPVVTIHSVGDGGAVPDQERWYAEQVRREGRGHDLVRQMYVDRGQHCSTSGADEVVALQTLLTHLDTGRWPSTSPQRLNAQVAEFDRRHQVVTDLSTFDPETGTFDRAFMPPAFARFTPPRPQRPSL